MAQFMGTYMLRTQTQPDDIQPEVLRNLVKTNSDHQRQNGIDRQTDGLFLDRFLIIHAKYCLHWIMVLVKPTRG